MKALFTYNYGEEKMKKIENLGYEVVYEHEKGITFREDFEDVDILVCYNPFNTLDIKKMTNLKWIQLSSIGIDQAPIDYLKEAGITLTNNKGGYSIPMGEWVVMKALEMVKNSKEMYENQKNKKWHMDTSILELYNKTIGFIGTGSIAKESAKRLQGFDMNVIGLNTRGTDVEYFDECYSSDEFEYMLSICDVVVLTIPYTEKTHHMINREAFEAMKDGAYLINVSRGSIIDENVMIDYLKNGKLGGAALDVFEEEPLGTDSPLWELDNVILTAHNSWISEMRNERRYSTIYRNMRSYINDEELINVVDLEKGY